jgi:hypothetical protein
MFERAKMKLWSKIKKVATWGEFIAELNKKNVMLAPW